MEKLKAFFKTTFFGGFLIVLPVILLIFVLDWFFNFLTDEIRPVTNILVETARLNELIASVAAILIILLVFFLVGLLVRTNLGSYLIGFLEEKILKRVPLYKIIKDTVINLFGDEKLIFKGVALVKPFGNDTMVTAFITDESLEGYTTVFIPSAPAPTGGYIYHIKNEFVVKLDYPVEQAMRTVLSLGGGSGQMLSAMIEKKS